MSFNIVYRDGHKLDRRTAMLLEAAEKRSGVKVRLIQGSFNHGVSASAGTHDGSGAFDVWPLSGRQEDAQKFLRAVRIEGAAAWIRDPSQGPWSYHIHGITIGNKGLAPLAAQQVSLYYRGYDGLAGMGRDPFWRPSPIRQFHMHKRRVAAVINGNRTLSAISRARGKVRLPGVKAVQKGLHNRGYHHLVIDGKAGPQTRAAFFHYRKRHDLGPWSAIFKLVPNKVERDKRR